MLGAVASATIPWRGSFWFRISAYMDNKNPQNMLVFPKVAIHTEGVVVHLWSEDPVIIGRVTPGVERKKKNKNPTERRVCLFHHHPRPFFYAFCFVNVGIILFRILQPAFSLHQYLFFDNHSITLNNFFRAERYQEKEEEKRLSSQLRSCCFLCRLM